jgi:hypothetical protein
MPAKQTERPHFAAFANQDHKLRTIYMTLKLQRNIGSQT